MSIASEIARLQQAKSDLATSIAAKGVTVPAATTLDGYAALVDQIQQGGGTLPYDAEIEYLEKSSGTNSLINLGTNANAIFEITAQATITKSSSMTLVNRNSASTGGTWFGVVSNGKWGLGTGSGAYSNVSALNKTNITVNFTVTPVVELLMVLLSIDQEEVII